MLRLFPSRRPDLEREQVSGEHLQIASGRIDRSLKLVRTKVACDTTMPLGITVPRRESLWSTYNDDVQKTHIRSRPIKDEFVE